MNMFWRTEKVKSEHGGIMDTVTRERNQTFRGWKHSKGEAGVFCPQKLQEEASWSRAQRSGCLVLLS
jgi:hypothetical protein